MRVYFLPVPLVLWCAKVDLNYYTRCAYRTAVERSPLHGMVVVLECCVTDVTDCVAEAHLSRADNQENTV